MKTVYKYELPMRDLATIRLPKGSDVLSVGCQGDALFVWCLVDPDEERITERTFRITGTGHPLNLNRKGYENFIGTAFMRDGALVWHVFEVTPA